MKNRIQPVLLPVVILALFLTGCKGLESIEITGVDNFKFLGIEESTVTFSADVGIYNPSAAPFKVREVNLKVLAEGNYIGSLHNNEMIRIAAHSDSAYCMPFSLKLGSILTSASILYTFSKKDYVNLELQGYIKSRSGLIIKKVDVQESLRVEVPELDFF